MGSKITFLSKRAPNPFVAPNWPQSLFFFWSKDVPNLLFGQNRARICLLVQMGPNSFWGGGGSKWVPSTFFWSKWAPNPFLGGPRDPNPFFQSKQVSMPSFWSDRVPILIFGQNGSLIDFRVKTDSWSAFCQNRYQMGFFAKNAPEIQFLFEKGPKSVCYFCQHGSKTHFFGRKRSQIHFFW